jgi:hypothetical protein
MKLDSQKNLSGCAFNAASHEVLGENSLSNKNPEGTICLSALCDHLSMNFHSTCACGLAQQIGRSAFTHLVRNAKNIDQLSDLTFRLLPTRLRLARGLGSLEKLVEGLFRIPVQVIEDEHSINLETMNSHESHTLLPYLEAGFIQEYIHWVSGGKLHPIKLIAQEPGWSIQVGKSPLES